MFGVSFTELVMVFVVALLLFGPERLPQMARQLGKVLGDLRRGSDAVKREFYNSVYPPQDEISRDLRTTAQELRSLTSEFSSIPKLPTMHDILADSNAAPPKLPPGGGRAASAPSVEIKEQEAPPETAPHRQRTDDKGDA